MEIISTNFINAAMQTFITMLELFGFLIFFGILLGYIRNKAINNIIKSTGFAGIIITCPGVILHELSHYIFAKIFGCSIREVKLFRPIEGAKDGTLGYVNFSYNQNNIIQKIGLFFIGFAPVIGGTVAMLLSMKVFLNNSYINLINNIKLCIHSNSIFDINFIKMQLNILKSVILDIFSVSNFNSTKFWIFIYISICISAHIALSTEDLKGSKIGLATILVSIFILNITASFTNVKIIEISDIIMIYNIMCLTLFNVMLIFSFAHFLFTFLIKSLFSSFRR